jgi:alkanesulfonate monooxygenase SsuD/methylene tetrahydromethanopterin reductase-like flavin-dependent oxidoreductase (luciferase family)
MCSPADNPRVSAQRRRAPRAAVVVPNAGAFADARVVAELARDAEGARWDAFFTWDTLEHEGKAVIDPWVALAACAVATRSVRLGPMVAATARRRPWKLAREALTLDGLSRGRLVLGLGAGYRDVGFSAFGEDASPRTKFAKLDETITLLDAFFSGGRIEHEGTHYRVSADPFLPRPARGRIPMWVALTGTDDRELTRAARVDGALGAVDGTSAEKLIEFIGTHRTRAGAFDVVFAVHEHRNVTAAREFVRSARDAGATWIRYEVGSIFDTVDDVRAARRFIRRGPVVQGD